MFGHTNLLGWMVIDGPGRAREQKPVAGSMPVAGRSVRRRAQQRNHMDEWIAHTYQTMIETWQREIVPNLLLGRAITFTIHASPNQPARFDCSQHFKDPAWPATSNQRKQ